MNKKHIILLHVFAIILFSCSPQEDPTKEPSSVTFEKSTLVEDESFQVAHLNSTYRVHWFKGFTNSYIFEGSDSVVVIDAPFYPKEAERLKNYIRTLGKPFRDIYVTHSHSDHWVTANLLGKNLRLISNRGVAHNIEVQAANLTPTSPVRITKTIEPGSYEILGGGLTFVIEEFENMEDLHGITIKVPEFGLFISGDMVYQNTHIVMSDSLGTARWIEKLHTFRQENGNYPLILTGHSILADSTAYLQDEEYLRFILNLSLEQEISAEEFKRRSIAAYPGFLHPEYIDITTSLILNLPSSAPIKEKK